MGDREKGEGDKNIAVTPSSTCSPERGGKIAREEVEGRMGVSRHLSPAYLFRFGSIIQLKRRGKRKEKTRQQ